MQKIVYDYNEARKLGESQEAFDGEFEENEVLYALTVADLRSVMEGDEEYEECYGMTYGPDESPDLEGKPVVWKEIRSHERRRLIDYISRHVSGGDDWVAEMRSIAEDLGYTRRPGPDEEE